MTKLKLTLISALLAIMVLVSACGTPAAVPTEVSKVNVPVVSSGSGAEATDAPASQPGASEAYPAETIVVVSAYPAGASALDLSQLNEDEIRTFIEERVLGVDGLADLISKGFSVDQWMEVLKTTVDPNLVLSEADKQTIVNWLLSQQK